MNTQSRRLATLALSAAFSVGLTVAVVRSVRAIGIPAAPSMYYRGTLDEGVTPVTGARMFTLRLMSAATGGTELCTTGNVSVTVTSGAFEVPLPAACTDAIRNQPGAPDLWQGLSLAGAVVGPRTRLGAVPYAVVAERASVAEGALSAQIAALQAQVAALGSSNPNCPADYTHDAALSSATVTVCFRTIAGGRDEVVKVGAGSRAFWVDRYEARVFDTTGRQYGASDTNYPNLAPNGQWTAGARGTLSALSRAGGAPSVNVTWFQANALCAAAGKTLIARDQWLLAADGLVAIDPAAPLNGNVAGVTGCNTGGTGARATGGGTGCASSWGAQDMIGNVWEWTDEWYASTGMVTSPAPSLGGRVNGVRVNDGLEAWGAGFGNDATWNITSVVYNPGEGQIGSPSAAIRGGYWGDGPRAGAFTLALYSGPSHQGPSSGFRCVVRR